jgi:hypothetical protein
MAKQIDDDFSAFDDVVSQPDSVVSEPETEDFSAFDQTISTPKQSWLEKAASGLTDAFTPSEDTKEWAQGVVDSGQDFAQGVAGGLTMNSLDEVGGLLGAGVESGLGKLGIGPAAVDAQLAEQGFKGAEQPFLEKYRDYQQGIEKHVKEGEARSPVLSTLGQVGGGITGGVALGGLLGLGANAGKAQALSEIAKNQGMSKAALELLKRGGVNYAKAAPAIALESGLTSKEKLIGEGANPEALAGDVAGGLAFGLPAMIGMQGVSELAVPKLGEMGGKIADKASQIAEDSPLFRQAKVAYQKYGQQYGVNPKSEKAIKEGIQGIEGGTPFSLLDKNRAANISQEILEKDKSLGAIVGNSLEEAAQTGQKIDADDLVKDTYKKVVDLATEMPSLTKDENFNKIMTKVLSRDYKTASPRDIKNAMDEITNTIERIGSYKYPSPELEEAPRILRELRRGLDQRLKDQVPSYRDAAERFAQYRSTYIEQPIAGGLDPALDDIYYGSMKKGDKKLQDAYEDLVKRSTGDSQSIETTEERYARLLQKAKEFQTAEQGRVAAGKIKTPITDDPMKFMQQIKDFADDAAVRRSTRHTQESQAGGTIALKNAAGIANTGKGAILTASYLAGKASNTNLAKKVSNLSRTVYNAPAQTLSNLATKLESTPGLGALGKSLREGLENSDSTKRNAALFTIMQNPNARLLINAEDFPDEEQE